MSIDNSYAKFLFLEKVYKYKEKEKQELGNERYRPTITQ